jgi:hypothetical protein
VLEDVALDAEDARQFRQHPVPLGQQPGLDDFIDVSTRQRERREEAALDLREVVPPLRG